MEFGEMKRSNFCMLLRRAGLTASAGLSCFTLLQSYAVRCRAHNYAKASDGS